MIISGISPSVRPSHHDDGRELLSRMLGRFLGIEGAEITVDSRDKPRIEGVRFSISHSEGLVMCSLFVPGEGSSLPVLRDGDEVSVDGEMFFASDAEECGDIGVDIELIDGGRDEARLRSLAQRYYSEAEREFVLDREDMRERFYRVWTDKESYLKLTGEGLSGIRRADTAQLGDGILRTSFRILHGGEKYSVSICLRGR